MTVVGNINGWINFGRVKLLDITIFLFTKSDIGHRILSFTNERKDSPGGLNNQCR